MAGHRARPRAQCICRTAAASRPALAWVRLISVQPLNSNWPSLRLQVLKLVLTNLLLLMSLILLLRLLQLRLQRLFLQPNFSLVSSSILETVFVTLTFGGLRTAMRKKTIGRLLILRRLHLSPASHKWLGLVFLLIRRRREVVAVAAVGGGRPAARIRIQQLESSKDSLLLVGLELLSRRLSAILEPPYQGLHHISTESTLLNQCRSANAGSPPHVGVYSEA